VIGALVPVCYFGSLVPAGVPTADGCSGGTQVAPSPGISYLGVPSALTEPPLPSPLPVGDRGFFVVVVGAYAMSEADVLSGVSFDVRTTDDASVSGSARILSSREYDQSIDVYLGWESDEALDAQTLNASASATGPNGALSAQASLVVEPAGRAVLDTASDWVRTLVLDHGPLTTCFNTCVGVGCCGSPIPFSYGADVGVAHEASFSVVPTADIVAVWDVTISEVAGKGRIVDRWDRRLYVHSLTSDGTFFLHFEDEGLDSYCVAIDARNLETDATTTEEACVSPEPSSEPVPNEDSIRGCDAPPPDAADRWCAARGLEIGSPSCSLAAAGGIGGGIAGGGGAGGTEMSPAGSGGAGSSGEGAATAGSGGTGAEPSGSGGDVATGGTGNAGAGDTASAGSNSDRVIYTHGGCGCRLPRAPVPPLLPLVAALALGSALVARRRRMTS
jgi:hypothetical protein